MSYALFVTRKQEILAKVKECIEKGNELFGITLPKLDVRFDLKGCAVGMALRRGAHFYLRFNADMMVRDAWEHIINDTVPHEVAHSFCQFHPRLGSNHDSGWANVCRMLGGTGARCHSEEVVYGKGTTYEYTTDRGHKVRMSDKHHAIVQSGRTLKYNKGKGTVTKACAYSIVGVRGRTLAAPVVKVPTAVLTPAQVPAYPVGCVAPVQQPVVRTPVPAFAAGLSKAATARAVMLSGHTAGRTYEQIIAAIMAATGHDRQLARATYKANYLKVGCPAA